MDSHTLEWNRTSLEKEEGAALNVPDLDSLSGRLIYALKRLNISQAELSRRIGVSQQAIQYLCSSKSQKSKLTFEIADALQIRGDWLGSGKGSMRLQEDPYYQFLRDQSKIPILKDHEILPWLSATAEQRPQAKDPAFLLTQTSLGQNAFSTIVTDKSMFPRFDQDTVVIIDPDVVPQRLDFVLAHIREMNGIIFRQWLDRDGIDELVPVNTAMYKRVVLNSDVRILGVMKEARWHM